MKSPVKKYPSRIIILLLFLVTLIFAKESKHNRYIDENQDGINDLFRDSNGDGINDITQEPYQHRFLFKDENRDGKNDLFTDDDGDGVNDLAREFVDNNQDGWNDNVIDHNQDWINDITGIIYDLRRFHGARYGFVLEELGIRVENFVDNDHDGQFDNMGKYRRHMMRDRFIDRDGDGMFDGRGFNRHRRKKDFRGRGKK